MRTIIQLALTATLAIIGLRAQCTLFVAPGGNDANPATQSAPLATPAQALQVATPGSVVCLRDGVYPITAGLAISTPLTLQSYPGELAVLSGIAGPSVGNIVVVFAGNVTLQDLEITGAAWYGIFVTSYLTNQPPANVHIRRCKIHDTGHIGIKAYQADSIVVEDSEIFATGRVDPSNAEGINIMAAIPAAGDPLNQGATVRRNYIHDVAGFGVYLKAGTQRGLIERNRVQRAAAGGIILGGDSGAIYMRNGVRYECIDCIARNNVVSDTQTLGLSCWGALNSRFYNNTVVNVAQSLQAAFFGVPNSAGTGCTNVRVENNVFVMSSTYRMVHLVNPGWGVYFNHNSYYNPTGDYKFWLETPAQAGYWDFSGWRMHTGNDRNSMSGTDPRLDATNGYQPGPGSPLIDAGMTVLEVVDDFVGTRRPQGSAYDIGAYEVLPPSVKAP
jgi:hypothetical protein